MNMNRLFTMDDVYIIAEIAQNHDGSLGMAHAFIDAVASAGASAIKFQTHIASEESTIHEPFRVNFSYCDKTRYDYWQRMEFTEEEWQGLYDHACEKGIDFLSSPFSLKALRMLDRIGVSAWKLGSGEVFNDVLLDAAIATGKPIIISTGLSSLEDTDCLVERIQRAGNKLVLMECTTAYPSKAENIPINMISKFIERYHCCVGISDHSATVFPALSAVTLGARCVEVHVTMSHAMFGPDVPASVTIDQLKEIVEGVAFIRKMQESSVDKKELSDETKTLRTMFSKCLYLNKEIKKGAVLSETEIGIKKPFNEKGIPAKNYRDVIGRTMAVDAGMDDLLKWEMLQ